MPTKTFARGLMAAASIAAIIHCGTNANDERSAPQPAARQYTITPADVQSGDAAQTVPANVESQPFLNMRPGDVLQKIDGDPAPDITSPDEALKLYESLRDKAEVCVTVLRSGKRVEYTYPVK